jgi:tRNA-dihydrouridine synthase 2
MGFCVRLANHRLRRSYATMPVSVHSISPPSSPQPPKRQKLDHNEAGPSTSTLNYRDGVMLAPMVRSGTRNGFHSFIHSIQDTLTRFYLLSVPTRLLSLRYGASLVWSPETVDRAIIGCERVVDRTHIPHLEANRTLTTLHSS